MAVIKLTEIDTNKIIDWIRSQGIAIVLLIATNYFQYEYFTGQIGKLENRVETLQNKVIELSTKELLK